ncbi:hypothetical protein BKA69DRAFT_506641 [Paraphysoderma sedebokerense]|nr:hypothetical protein BKA69DRAFT_506641 [Paraphysoderma sedebokerense]
MEVVPDSENEEYRRRNSVASASEMTQTQDYDSAISFNPFKHSSTSPEFPVPTQIQSTSSQFLPPNSSESHDLKNAAVPTNSSVPSSQPKRRDSVEEPFFPLSGIVKDAVCIQTSQESDVLKSVIPKDERCLNDREKSVDRASSKLSVSADDKGYESSSESANDIVNGNDKAISPPESSVTDETPVPGDDKGYESSSESEVGESTSTIAERSTEAVIDDKGYESSSESEPESTLADTRTKTGSPVKKERAPESSQDKGTIEDEIIIPANASPSVSRPKNYSSSNEDEQHSPQLPSTKQEESESSTTTSDDSYSDDSSATSSDSEGEEEIQGAVVEEGDSNGKSDNNDDMVETDTESEDESDVPPTNLPSIPVPVTTVVPATTAILPKTTTATAVSQNNQISDDKSKKPQDESISQVESEADASLTRYSEKVMPSSRKTIAKSREPQLPLQPQNRRSLPQRTFSLSALAQSQNFLESVSTSTTVQSTFSRPSGPTKTANSKSSALSASKPSLGITSSQKPVPSKPVEPSSGEESDSESESESSSSSSSGSDSSSTDSDDDAKKSKKGEKTASKKSNINQQNIQLAGQRKKKRKSGLASLARDGSLTNPSPKIFNLH